MSKRDVLDEYEAFKVRTKQRKEELKQQEIESEQRRIRREQQCRRFASTHQQEASVVIDRAEDALDVIYDAVGSRDPSVIQYLGWAYKTMNTAFGSMLQSCDLRTVDLDEDEIYFKRLRSMLELAAGRNNDRVLCKNEFDAIQTAARELDLLANFMRNVQQGIYRPP